MTIQGNQEALCAIHSLGCKAWPEIELDIGTFVERAGGLVNQPIDSIRADELYLATACAASVEPAIAAFDRHYLSGLAAALTRRGLDAAAAADVVQAVRVRFLVGEAGRPPRIAEYDGSSSLASWIHVAATRIAISARRKHHRETADDVVAVSADRSPELDLLHRQLGAKFEAAFRSTFESLSPRERTLLRYQVIDRLGIDRIAAIYGIHRATAARWTAHAREALVAGVRRVLQERLGLGSSELDSLLGLVRSQLELSLELLETPARG